MKTIKYSGQFKKDFKRYHKDRAKVEKLFLQKYSEHEYK